MQKVKAIINISNLQENTKKFVKQGRKLCAVVKANAYGHGAEEIVNGIESFVDCFAVALIDEGICIKTACCGKDVLVFTPPINEAEVLALAQNRFLATVPDLWTAKLLVQTCKAYGLCIRVHLKVNTGMNRYGMHLSMLGKVCKYLSRFDCVSVEGIYSHLYSLKRKTSEEQRTKFLAAIRVCKRYFPNVISHLGGTYAALLGDTFDFDMVRVGIGLYGYLPCKSELPLKKVMRVYATTVCVRKCACGGIGYGKRLQESEVPKYVSVCRFGYADGFLRKRKNGVDGFKENANNLCMDVCIRENNKKRGEVVPILTDAAKTAELTGTIAYEVLCAATRRAEFVYEYE